MTIRHETEFSRIFGRRMRQGIIGFALAGGCAAALAQNTTQPAPLPPPAGSTPAPAATQPAAKPAEKPADKPATPPPAATADAGYVRVTAKAVNIRSRADVNSIPVARVNRETVLRVLGKEYGWYKIQPPAGTFYFVAARYVERTGDKSGTVKVSTTPLNVRVGSQVMTIDPEKADVVGQIGNGTQLEILSQEGEWLRIAAPAGIACYISEDFVERVGDAEGSSAMAKQPAVATGEKPAVSGEALKPTTSAPALSKEDLAGNWGQQFDRLEQKIQAEAEKPILQQSWDAIAENLKRIAAQREEPQIAAAAESWIPRVERQRIEQDTQRQRARVAARDQQGKAQLEGEMANIKKSSDEFDGRTDFEAIGMLRPTFALPVGENGLRYKLVDPTTNQTRAYIEIPTELGLEIKTINGKYVGIFGERLMNEEFKDIGAPMFRVDKLVILTAPVAKPATKRERP